MCVADTQQSSEPGECPGKEGGSVSDKKNDNI